MAGLNGGEYEPSEDIALVALLTGKKWKPEAGSYADMNNGKSVEGGFQDYVPTAATVHAANKDFIENILGIPYRSK